MGLDNHNNFFYKESGKVNHTRLVMSYFVCLILTIFLGYFYSFLIVIMPIVYINYLITTGYGIILGFACRFLIRVSQNRDKRSQLALSIIVGLMANYFQWTAYIFFAYKGSFPLLTEYLLNLHWIVVPENFFNAINEISKTGLWSIFGVPVDGPVLVLIWILEGIIIGVIPVIAVYRTKIYPYSELLQKWYPKYTLFKDFEYLSSMSLMIENLKNDAYKTINSLMKGDGHRHCKIHLFYLREEAEQYLTFENVVIEIRGTGKEVRNIVINNFAIDKKTADAILEAFEHKKEGIEII